MINQGVQSLLQAPEIDWVLQQRLCLLNYWQLSFFFFFFLCEFLSSSERQCVCCCFSPGHTWKWGAADLVPQTAPCSSREQVQQPGGNQRKGMEKKKKNTFSYVRCQQPVPSRAGYVPFPPEKFLWRSGGFSLRLFVIFSLLEVLAILQLAHRAMASCLHPLHSQLELLHGILERQKSLNVTLLWIFS